MNITFCFSNYFPQMFSRSSVDVVLFLKESSTMTSGNFDSTSNEQLVQEHWRRKQDAQQHSERGGICSQDSDHKNSRP